MKPSNPKYTPEQVGLIEPKPTKQMKQTTKVNLTACAFIIIAITLMVIFWSSCKKAKPTDQTEPTPIDTNTYIVTKFSLKITNANYWLHIRNSSNKYLFNRAVADTATFTTKVIKGDSLFYSITYNQQNVFSNSKSILTITFDSLVYKVDTIQSTQYRRVWMIVK